MLVLDLAGTFVFALSGAVAGVRQRLDLFGVLVLSFVAACAGGIMRDLLIGAAPLPVIKDWRYLGVSLLAGLVIFLWFPRSSKRDRMLNLMLVFDGAGLALFAVVGAQKALGFGLNPVMAAMLGMVSGTGGGVLRDLLVAEIPNVLRSELYAVAALAGATVVVVGHLLNLPPAVSASVGAAFCFGIRLIAIWRGWRLPVAHLPEQSPPGTDAQADSTDDRAKRF